VSDARLVQARAGGIAEDLGAEPIRVQGSDVAKALIQVAHDKNVGSIIIGHSRHGRLHELVRGSIVQNLLRLAGDVDVHVVADPRSASLHGVHPRSASLHVVADPRSASLHGVHPRSPQNIVRMC
jgi:K+-sensing histidine kinase KdpD